MSRLSAPPSRLINKPNARRQHLSFLKKRPRRPKREKKTNPPRRIMQTVAQRQEMALRDFPPHHAHTHHSNAHAPRRVNTTTALDTQNIDSMKHHHQSQSQSHIRVNSLSSGGSLSDYSTILRTPQDPVQSENDALIVKQQDDSPSSVSNWKPSMGMVQETLTSSPIEETFPRGSQGTLPTGGKPIPMQINTSFVPRSRPVAYSAHPNQKTAPSGGASQLHNAPQSATAAFPPMQLPTSAAAGATPPSATSNGVTGRHTPFMGRTIGVGTNGTDTKLSDTSRHQQQYQAQHPPSQSQHRRTQSAPLLSLSTLAPTASTPVETQGNNPLTPPVTSPGFGGGRLSYPQQQPQQQDLQSLQSANYPQLNPMAQGGVFRFVDACLSIDVKFSCRNSPFRSFSNDKHVPGRHASRLSSHVASFLPPANRPRRILLSATPHGPTWRTNSNFCNQ